MRRKFVAFFLMVLLLCTSFGFPVNAAVGDEVICTATAVSSDGMYRYQCITDRSIDDIRLLLWESIELLDAVINRCTNNIYL